MKNGITFPRLVQVARACRSQQRRYENRTLGTPREKEYCEEKRRAETILDRFLAQIPADNSEPAGVQAAGDVRTDRRAG